MISSPTSPKPLAICTVPSAVDSAETLLTCAKLALASAIPLITASISEPPFTRAVMLFMISGESKVVFAPMRIAAACASADIAAISSACFGSTKLFPKALFSNTS